ncbi:MAG: Crp/Fnr family transcriptional regulator [Actinomycetota bacterium]
MTPFLQGWREDSPVREAAWVARCVGDAATTPLTERDLEALASYLQPREFERGSPLFRSGEQPHGVWIVRLGMIELSVGSGPRKVIVQLLYPGNVDGDIQLILGMPLPYSGRALEATRCLFLESGSFEALLRDHPAVARRWLSSIAARVSGSQARIIGLLGRSLVQQTARLLLDEQHGGRVPLPQRTLAAMLGVRRPSQNKVLKDLEKRGFIALGYGRIEIADEDGLERLAQERR